MFAYCNNNAVLFRDNAGARPILSTSLSNETRREKDCSFAYMIPKTDITAKLNKTMKENAAIITEISNNYDSLTTSLAFALLVMPKGAWDLKEQKNWDLRKNRTYVYNGVDLRYDDIGNIHYGYVGRVHFTSNTLLVMGGIVQIATRTSSWSYINSNFDDPRDQWAIQFGCYLWDMEALS